MKKNLITFFFIFTFSLSSQNTLICSFQQKLSPVSGSKRIILLNDRVFVYGFIYLNKSINIAKEAIQLSKLKRFSKVRVLNYYILGRADYIPGNNELAEKYYKDATDKKEDQISLQKSIIKQKDHFIVLSTIAGSIILAALLIIFILYGKKNQAYKLLVYKSLENNENKTLIIPDNISDEEQLFEIKYNNSPLDEGFKKQIEKLLKKELESKIFVDSNLTLKMLAVKCHTNRSYFSQFIHEQYNMNFNTFINMLRINEAKLMLADKNNSLPLKELYLLLGFNTYSVFNEAFKKHVGVTPAFYLKTIQELQEVTNPN